MRLGGDDLFQSRSVICQAARLLAMASFLMPSIVIAQTGAPLETAGPDKPFEIGFPEEGGPTGFQVTQVEGISNLFLLSGGSPKESHPFFGCGWGLQELHDRREVTVFLRGGCGVNLIKPSDKDFLLLGFWLASAGEGEGDGTEQVEALLPVLHDLR